MDAILIFFGLISLVESLATREIPSEHNLNPSQGCHVAHSQVHPGSSFVITMNISDNFCEWIFRAHSSSLAVLDVSSALCVNCDCGFVEYGTVNNYGKQVIHSRVCGRRDMHQPLISSAVWVAVSYQEDCAAAKSDCFPSFGVDFIRSEYRENQLIVQIGFFGVIPLLLCVPFSVYCVKLHRKSRADTEPENRRRRRRCSKAEEGTLSPRRKDRKTERGLINKRLTKQLHRKMKSLLQQRDSIDSMADNIQDPPNSEIHESTCIQLSSMPPTPLGSIVIDLNDLGTPVGEEATVGSYVSFDGFIGESDVYSSQNEGTSQEIIDDVEKSPLNENKRYSLQPEIYCPPSPESFFLDLNLRQDEADQTEDIFKGCSGEINVDADSDESQLYACTLRNKSEEMKRLRSPSLDFRATERAQPHRDMSTPERTESVKSFNSGPRSVLEVSHRTDPALEAFPILQGLASFTWGHPSPADFCPHLLSPVSEWNEFFTVHDSQC